MESIRKRKYYFGILTCTNLILLIVVINIFDIYKSVQLLVAINIMMVLVVLFGVLWIREFKKFKIAQLISDNKIFHIYPAIVCNKNNHEVKFKAESSVEVLISYFGILLGSTIIKFNQEGIRLLDIEIGSEFIYLTYGTDKRVQGIRLLCSNIKEDELNKIVERFKYETGIIPTITN